MKAVAMDTQIEGAPLLPAATKFLTQFQLVC